MLRKLTLRVGLLVLMALVLRSEGALATNSTGSTKPLSEEERCARVEAPVFHDGLGLILLREMATKGFKGRVGFESIDPFVETGEMHDVYTVIVVNHAGQTIHANPHHLRAVTDTGRTLEPSSWTFRTNDPFPAVDVDPGDNVQGFVAFSGLSSIERIIYDDGIRRVERDAFDGFWLAGCLKKPAKKPK